MRYVCTINEPNIAAMLAGGEDAANLVAYGLPNPDLHVADQLLASHKRSREVLSQVPGLQSGWTIATQAFRANGEPGSEEMLREYGYPRDDWYLEQAAGDDFLGVQAYTRTFIGASARCRSRTTSRRPSPGGSSTRRPRPTGSAAHGSSPATCR